MGNKLKFEKKVVNKRNEIMKSFNEKIGNIENSFQKQHEIAWEIRNKENTIADDKFDVKDAELKKERDEKVNSLKDEGCKILQFLENDYFSSKGKWIFNLLSPETLKQLNKRPLQKSVFQSILLDYEKSFTKEKVQRLANLVLRADDGYSFEYTKDTVIRLIITDSWTGGSLSE